MAAGSLLVWLQTALIAPLPAHRPPTPRAASESCLLAALWTLESLHSAWRSSATAALASYVKLLAAFSPEVWVLRCLWPGGQCGWAAAGVAPPSRWVAWLGRPPSE